jgi:hypothetical protein
VLERLAAPGHSLRQLQQLLLPPILLHLHIVRVAGVEVAPFAEIEVGTALAVEASPGQVLLAAVAEVGGGLLHLGAHFLQQGTQAVQFADYSVVVGGAQTRHLVVGRPQVGVRLLV